MKRGPTPTRERPGPLAAVPAATAASSGDRAVRAAPPGPVPASAGADAPRSGPPPLRRGRRAFALGGAAVVASTPVVATAAQGPAKEPAHVSARWVLRRDDR